MKTEVLEAIKQRRSCRSYKKEQITEEELKAVLDAAVYSPTGRGLQSPKMVVVQDADIIEKLRKINASVMGSPDSDPFYGAPTVVIVFADSTVSTHLEDGSLLMGTLLLSAHAAGLGSCWIHRAKETFESEEGKLLMKKWGIDEKYIGIGNCILGYENGAPAIARERKKDYIVRV